MRQRASMRHRAKWSNRCRDMAIIQDGGHCHLGFSNSGNFRGWEV